MVELRLKLKRHIVDGIREQYGAARAGIVIRTKTCGSPMRGSFSQDDLQHDPRASGAACSSLADEFLLPSDFVPPNGSRRSDRVPRPLGERPPVGAFSR
jgi:hypothetical protein